MIYYVGLKNEISGHILDEVVINFLELLYPAWDYSGSGAYPGNAGCEAGLHSGWNADHWTYVRTYGQFRIVNPLTMFLEVERDPKSLKDTRTDMQRISHGQ